MTQENDTEKSETGSPVFALFRTVLIIILVCYLLFIFAKSNPRIQAMLQKWSDAQNGAVNGILSASGETMGTYWNVKISSPNKKWSEEKLAETAQGIFDNVDRLMSTYRADSEVSRFNATDSTDWFDVSSETAQTAELAKQTAFVTDGALDITIAPLVDFWKFGPDKTPLDTLPTDAEIEECRAKTGIEKLDIRTDPPALKKAIAELAIDLSAVAKGFAVDMVAQRLTEEIEKKAIAGFMVDVGGEVRCGGHKGAQTPGTPQKGTIPWTMGIEKPIDAAPGAENHPQPALPQLARIVRVQDGAIATSGGARNAFEIGGKRFSHIIDPATGKPTELVDGVRRVGSVSVFLASCAEADAYATALYVLGPEKGIPLADRLNLPVLYLMKDDENDSFTEIISSAFEKIDSEPVSGK